MRDFASKLKPPDLMFDTYSFGEWVKRRRKELHLTQREVATAAFCSTAMIKKIEADERQPSPELAESLADALQVSSEQRAVFIEVARGQRPVDSLTRQEMVTEVAPAPLHLSPVATPLPIPATSFIGRTKEVEAVSAQLRRDEVRLVTLMGPGGMGKTRLAIEVAQTVQTGFSDGAVFVSLTAVSDPEQIPQAILQALHLPLVSNDSPLIQTQRFLQRRDLLMVLDNFEQLTAGAVLISELLAAAPRLKLLVTSRERLNLAEEWLFPVPELDEAVTLFGQTAIRVKPDFDVRGEETAVANICQLVGKHPLAVELAASWRRFMPCAQIAAQIQKDLDFLASGPRNAPERHRSLRALFDHSWHLLTPVEQNALAKLSVFRGGFASEQAADVAGADWSILLGLVNKSLVETKGDNRFDLHELTRQYAAVKLDELGQTKATQQAHFDAYAMLAAQLTDLSSGSQAHVSFRRAEQELDNIRAALDWGLAQRQTEAVLELIHHNFRFWLPGGFWREGEKWATAAVAQAGNQDSDNLCLVLNHLATFTALQGRFQDAFPLSTRAYRMARRLEEPWPLAMTLFLQGQGLPDKAASLAAFEEAIAICREHAGERKYDSFLNSVLRLRAERLAGWGMIAEAKAGFEESLARMRAIGETLEIVYLLGNLGRLALLAGDLEEAYKLIDESVTIARHGGHPVGIADWTFRLGQVYLYLGDLEAAEVNLQETLQRYEEVGNHFGPPCVLSNLALVALEGGDVAAAVAYIQDSFSRYRQLHQAIYQIDASAVNFRFGDTLESLLHAGLVAYARGDERKALVFFEYFVHHGRQYEAIRPLQERVESARIEIQANLPSSEYTATVVEAQRLTLDKLLAISL